MKTLADWPRVKRVLEGALACEGADRQAYLAEACGTDAALRAQIDILLAAQDRAGTFLETPAARLLDEPRGREDLSGRVVSSYRLLSRVGAGGMARCISRTMRSWIGPWRSSSCRRSSPKTGTGCADFIRKRGPRRA